MKNPASPDQLAAAIESLVASYVAEVRLAAQRAVERSLFRRVSAQNRVRSSAMARSSAQPPRRHRSPAELDAVCEELYKRVRARPGASMVTLAEEMGMPLSLLKRPMARLRTEGRVRRVGERHLTRYFPALLRAAAGKE